MQLRTLLKLIIVILTFTSCSQTNEEKLEILLNSETIKIQVNSYGGLAGYFEHHYYVTKKDTESLIIIDKGTDYQTFVRIRDDRKLLNEFFIKCVETHNPEKQLISTCLGPNDNEYVFRSGLTKLTVKPSMVCDSIFGKIMSRNTKI